MNAFWRIGITALTMLAQASVAAAADRVIASLSTQQVLITSNFTGVDLVLFGIVERADETPSHHNDRDLVVVVRGPSESALTQRKEYRFGMWVNANSRAFANVPSYVSVLSNRPLATITDSDRLHSLRLGLAYALSPQIPLAQNPGVAPDDGFGAAFLRLKQAHGLYVEKGDGVTFLSQRLFRATIPLPAQIAVGSYEIELVLFANQSPIAYNTSAFDVQKSGVTQLIASTATDHGVVYGLSMVCTALLAGFGAAAVFKRT